MSSFFLPKASPLYVSKLQMSESLHCTLYNMIFPLFQKDFYMAVSWWVDTGLYQKMRSDVQEFYGGHSAEKDFWTKIPINGNETPLNLHHLLPAFFILGPSLMFSTIVFALEVLCYRASKSKVSRQKSGRSKDMISDQSLIKMEDEIITEDVE